MDTPLLPPPDCVLFPESSRDSIPSLYRSLPRHNTVDNDIPGQTNDDIHLVPTRFRRCSDEGRAFISPLSPGKLSLPWFGGRHPSYAPIEGYKKYHTVKTSFEASERPKIIIHIILCLVAYPMLFLFVIIACNKTLFWSRFFVGVGCSAIGFALGLSLLSLARPFLEAATWAMIIHQSRINDAPGIRLSDLAAPSRDPTVNISTSVSHQHTEYQEVTVKGDLSESDISTTAALTPTFNDFKLTWTLSPFAVHGSLPTAISYPWNNDTVYFSEASLSQFLPDGSGFGTFAENTTTPTLSTDSASVATDSFNTNAVEPGSFLRYPRWGIRIHCEKVPDGSKNIIPKSFNDFTYLFTPRKSIDTLFSSFGLDRLAFSSYQEDNVTAALQLNDTLPSTVDVNGTAFAASFTDNGVAHTFKSNPVTMGEEGFGWISIEWVLVRLNTTYSRDGTFAIYSDDFVLDENRTETRIGYDAAVCLELYEPYIVETYNSTTGVPSSTGIISQNKEITDSSDEKRTGHAVTGSNVKRQLNSTGLKDVYVTLHGNSVNQMIKDNGRDAYYVPSPTLISFTNGAGPYGYTELSGELFAQARARADATNVLPYFAGSADTLAFQYPDLVLAYAEIHTLYMVSLLITVLCVGVIAGFFVPTLPSHVPRRGFDVYSWLAAFRANELIIDTDTKSIRKGMETKEMAKLMGDSRISYQW